MAEPHQPDSNTDLLEKPIHPGQPGSTPFWNTHCRRFIWAPSFEFRDEPGNHCYRFHLRHQDLDQTFEFSAEKPWSPLSPVWNAMPGGKFMLTVYAETSDGSRQCGRREFIKSPPFPGTLPERAYDFRDSGLRCLRDLFHQDRLQCWLRGAGPDIHYPKWTYPGKTGGAILSAMTTLAEKDEELRENAIEIAEKTAAFLLTLREPADTPLAGLFHTYWDGADADIAPSYSDQIMMSEPPVVAEGFLDLYAQTENPCHLDAAVQVAKIYQRLQRDDGSWHQWILRRTGEPKVPNILIPTAVINLLDRLRRDHGIDQFEETRQRAFQFCLDGPLQSYLWSAQFEDTLPQPPYKNQSHREPAQLAILLFQDGSPEKIQAAEELVRFVEDCFVIWSESDQAAQESIFQPGSRWYGTDPDFGLDWILPAAVEQFRFFTPICGTSAQIIQMWMSGYRVTGNQSYRRKSTALANALTLAQRYYGGREIPTHLRKVKPEVEWINCCTFAATCLIEEGPDLLAPDA